MRDSAKADYARRSVMDQLVKLNPAAVEAKFGSLPTAMLEAARNSVARNYFQKDPTTAWDWITQQPRPQQLAARVLEDVFPTKPELAVEYLAKLTDTQRDYLYIYGVNGWQTTKGDALVKALTDPRRIPESTRRSLTDLFYHRLLSHIPQNLESLTPLIEPQDMERYVHSYVDHYAKTAPSLVEKLLSELPLGKAREVAEARWQKVQAKK